MTIGRSDGKKVKGLPYFDLIIPHIMDKRYDASNVCNIDFDYGPIRKYIISKKAENIKLHFMPILIAAYLKTVKEKPEFNRFIMNKKIYARNHICVSFVVLRDIEETVAKVYFSGDENIFEVQEKVEKAINEARDSKNVNKVDNVLSLIFSFGAIAGFVVGLIKFLDKHNWLPKFVIDASPFHTSLFISNMASIRMSPVTHHLYEFGTTSIFVGLGAREKKVYLDKYEEVRENQVVPISTTTDERICPGIVFAEGFALLKHFMKNPKLLEE
jgi:hypothetical protein